MSPPSLGSCLFTECLKNKDGKIYVKLKNETNKNCDIQNEKKFVDQITIFSVDEDQNT